MPALTTWQLFMVCLHQYTPKQFNNKKTGTFLVVQRLKLHAPNAGMQGVWVWCLVRKLRSHMLCGAVKKKKKENQWNQLFWYMKTKVQDVELFTLLCNCQCWIDTLEQVSRRRVGRAVLCAVGLPAAHWPLPSRPAPTPAVMIEPSSDTAKCPLRVRVSASWDTLP